MTHTKFRWLALALGIGMVLLAHSLEAQTVTICTAPDDRGIGRCETVLAGHVGPLPDLTTDPCAALVAAVERAEVHQRAWKHTTAETWGAWIAEGDALDANIDAALATAPEFCLHLRERETGT